MLLGKRGKGCLDRTLSGLQGFAGRRSTVHYVMNEQLFICEVIHYESHGYLFNLFILWV